MKAPLNFPGENHCEACDAPTKRRTIIGDFVRVCGKCLAQSKRHERMNASIITAEELEDEISDLGLVSFAFEKKGKNWVCTVKNGRDQVEISVQRVPFEALADACYRLPTGSK